MGELPLRPVGEERPGHCGGCRRRLGALHEGGALLEEGWGASGRWGLRAVDTTLGQWIPTLVEQADSSRLGAGPASNHDHWAPAQTSARERCRRTCDGGAGLCGKSPGLTLSGPVSTALTLPSLPSKRPAGIVEILRFLSGAQHRCTRDVSTMDTSDPPDLFPPRIVTSRTTIPPERVPRKS